MRAKAIQHEEGMAIVVEQSLLDQLNIAPGMELEVATDGHMLMIMPIRDEERRAKFEEFAEEMEREYWSVFQRLAE